MPGPNRGGASSKLRALKNLPGAANAFTQKGGAKAAPPSQKELSGNVSSSNLFVPTGAVARGDTPSMGSAPSSGPSRSGTPRDQPYSPAETASMRARAASEQSLPRNVELARAYSD